MAPAGPCGTRVGRLCPFLSCCPPPPTLVELFPPGVRNLKVNRGRRWGVRFQHLKTLTGSPTF